MAGLLIVTVSVVGRDSGSPASTSLPGPATSAATTTEAVVTTTEVVKSSSTSSIDAPAQRATSDEIVSAVQRITLSGDTKIIEGVWSDVVGEVRIPFCEEGLLDGLTPVTLWRSGGEGGALVILAAEFDNVEVDMFFLVQRRLFVGCDAPSRPEIGGSDQFRWRENGTNSVIAGVAASVDNMLVLVTVEQSHEVEMTSKEEVIGLMELFGEEVREV